MSHPPEPTVIDRRRTAVLDEAGPFDGRHAADATVDLTSMDAAPSVTPRRAASRDLVSWPMLLGLGLIVALVVAGFALMPVDGDTSSSEPAISAQPAPPAETLDVPPAASNAALAIGTAASFTSTIRVDEDEDLFETLAADPSAGSRLAGAPVNGDAVVVQQVFGPDAFSVTSGTGDAAVLVYVPGATDELVGFVPDVTRVLFVGSLHPAPADLGVFLGSEPASIAAGSGAYVVAVPETVVQVRPPSA